MNFLWLKAREKDKEKILLKCYKNKIFVYDTKHTNNSFYFKIALPDYPTFQKLAFWQVKVEEQTGLFKIKAFLIKYKIYLGMCLLGFLIFLFLTHIMISVEVIHSNKEIRDLLYSELAMQGLKKNTWQKSFAELAQIKENILNKYPTKLEWLEIEVKGMKYIIRVEERKIMPQEEEPTKCNIVATKSGIVKKLIYSKGEANVKTNDSVNKGDILITGTLKKDEETKNTICAKGNVYAEVWYRATVKMPLKKEENILTGKTRFNIKLKNNNYNDFLLRSRISNYEEENYPLFTFFGNTISLVKQKEIIKKESLYSDEQLDKEADNLLETKIKETLEEKETIITKKVLAKTKEDDTFIVSYFVVLLEQIGEQQVF